MGKFININGQMRELVRVKSDNPTHAGYYTTYRDKMKPGEEEYFEAEACEMECEPRPGIQVDPGDPPLKPIKQIRRSRKQ
jgi:hypothetical protein